mmetsp:Transcript_25570/g.56251  ORF Transcript_25570/g.56251 Transcript_25570/m.56251 type:complete len:179 (+) Transcript_25570:646-1182(+)
MIEVVVAIMKGMFFRIKAIPARTILTEEIAEVITTGMIIEERTNLGEDMTAQIIIVEEETTKLAQAEDTTAITKRRKVLGTFLQMTICTKRYEGESEPMPKGNKAGLADHQIRMPIEQILTDQTAKDPRIIHTARLIRNTLRTKKGIFRYQPHQILQEHPHQRDQREKLRRRQRRNEN